MSKLRVFEAFSGVGSQRMALRNLGIEHEVVAISEIDKYALQSYEGIHGDCPNIGDISKLTVDDIPNHDLFTYSFPCTDISREGNMDGLDENSGTRSSLLWECKRVIEGKKPKYLLLENVPDLINKHNKPNFLKWLDWLESQGYSNYWKLLNAKTHGNIPQNRDRVFVVSILGNESFDFPAPIKLNTPLSYKLQRYVDESYYITDELYNQLVVKTGIETLFIKNATKLGYLEAFKHDGIDLTYPKSKTRRGRVQKQSIQTLKTACNLGVYDGFGIRYLTSLEYWRLMGFSDIDYLLAKESGVPDRQLYKQAGNAIVVPVLEGIFSQLFVGKQLVGS